MVERNTVMRSLHDIGLAAWFGGSLMGAVGLNRAAEEEGSDEGATARISSVGWAAWAPVNAAVGAHLVGGTGLLGANSERVRYQQGVGASTAAKALLTAAALAATAYSRVLGKKVELSSSPNLETAEQSDEHPISADKAQRQLTVLQWTVPALTAGVVVLNALHGEQQRPSQQKEGMLRHAASNITHLMNRQ